MPWKIEDAKQQFSELLNAVVDEPQLIYDHNQLVAALVKADVFQEFLVWQQQAENKTLANTFAELREICAEEDYQLESLARHDRPNPFAESSHDVSV
jgi:PHD/YefM family antitoxin component YafN of YafNO toxin-antitoxin module